MHALYDEAKVARRKYVVATRALREINRQDRERKAGEAHERLLNEIVGAAYREAEREKVLTSAIRSAEAITAFLNKPDHYPLELVTEALAKLKADGAFDRILAEPVE